jgi:hypothetical protein
MRMAFPPILLVVLWVGATWNQPPMWSVIICAPISAIWVMITNARRLAEWRYGVAVEQNPLTREVPNRSTYIRKVMARLLLLQLVLSCVAVTICYAIISWFARQGLLP